MTAARGVRGTVVTVAYYFPPLAGIASARAEGMVRHLRALGWDPVVVTAREGDYLRSDHDETDARVIRTRHIELSRTLRRGYGVATAGRGADRGTADSAGVRSKLRRVVRDYAYVPDAQLGWIPFAARAARSAALEAAQPAVLYSSSVPYSAHLAAMRAGGSGRIPWVAELRDPWVTGRRNYPSESRLRRRIDGRLEARVLAHADHVVVTSQGLAEDLLAARPDLEDRVSVIRNGFDPGADGVPPERGQPMTILYAGTVAPGENMTPVLKILDQIQATEPGAFRLQVLGPEDAWDATGRPWLELLGTVAPAAARATMADSSVLLLVQMDQAYRRVVPGKLYEYVGVQRPVVALIPPATEMGALLEQHADARLVHDPDAFASAVRALLEEHRAGSLQKPRSGTASSSNLERRAQAQELAKIFEKVTSGRG